VNVIMAYQGLFAQPLHAFLACPGAETLRRPLPCPASPARSGLEGRRRRSRRDGGAGQAPAGPAAARGPARADRTGADRTGADRCHGFLEDLSRKASSWPQGTQEPLAMLTLGSRDAPRRHDPHARHRSRFRRPEPGGALDRRGPAPDPRSPAQAGSVGGDDAAPGARQQRGVAVVLHRGFARRPRSLHLPDDRSAELPDGGVLARRLSVRAVLERTVAGRVAGGDPRRSQGATVRGPERGADRRLGAPRPRLPPASELAARLVRGDRSSLRGRRRRDGGARSCPTCRRR
jgi:hypothetical protein